MGVWKGGRHCGTRSEKYLQEYRIISPIMQWKSHFTGWSWNNQRGKIDAWFWAHGNSKKHSFFIIFWLWWWKYSLIQYFLLFLENPLWRNHIKSKHVCAFETSAENIAFLEERSFLQGRGGWNSQILCYLHTKRRSLEKIVLFLKRRRYTLWLLGSSARPK